WTPPRTGPGPQGAFWRRRPGAGGGPAPGSDHRRSGPPPGSLYVPRFELRRRLAQEWIGLDHEPVGDDPDGKPDGQQDRDLPPADEAGESWKRRVPLIAGRANQSG